MALTLAELDRRLKIHRTWIDAHTVGLEELTNRIAAAERRQIDVEIATEDSIHALTERVATLEARIEALETPPPPPPNASFSIGPPVPLTGSPVLFSAAETGPPGSVHTWENVGGSVFGQGYGASFVYSAVGNKTVRHTITEPSGRVTYFERTFSVGLPATPPPATTGPPEPTLSDPLTIELRRANKNLTLQAGRDYVLLCKEKLPGNVRIRGGRNIVVKNLHCEVPFQTVAQINADRYLRRGPQFDDFSGHLYIRDFYLGGDDLAEGIITNKLSGAANTKATLFNGYSQILTRAYTRVNDVTKALSKAPTWGTSYSVGQTTYDGLKATSSGKWWDEHGDGIFQSWVMPNDIHVERVTCITPCQADYLEPGTSANRLTLKDVNVHPYQLPGSAEKVAGRFFWASGWLTTVNNVWADWADKGLAGVTDGVPPGGDFVNPAHVGLNGV